MHHPSPPARPAGTILLLANLCCTGMLVGLIWTIQLVHYPLLLEVGEAAFPAYLAGHQARITILAGPWMVAELLTAALLLRWRPAVVPRKMVVAGFLLCLVAWTSTLLVQVPLWGWLADGYNGDTIRHLTDSNWLRTAAWTARGTLCLLMAWRLVATPENAR
jgi:hypothetical protein